VLQLTISIGAQLLPPQCTNPFHVAATYLNNEKQEKKNAARESKEERTISRKRKKENNMISIPG
jgi:hypothetical protein